MSAEMDASYRAIAKVIARDVVRAPLPPAKARMESSYDQARQLGAEVGIVGFGGQGFPVTGVGNMPVFGSTFEMMVKPRE